VKALYAALWAETIKVLRSRVFWLSQLFFVFVTLMMGLMMFIQSHPEISGKLGIIGTKASMLRFGEPVWQNYFALIKQALAAIGMIGYGFVTSWMFGREYSDKTIKDILALPVSRSIIVGAKFIVTAAWCIILSLVFYAFALVGGWLAGTGGWSVSILKEFTGAFASIAFLTMLLCTPVAFFAGTGRGYLLPFAFIILTLMLANFTGLLGLGPWFPWSIPGMLSVPPSKGGQLSVASYFILLITSLCGYLATQAWWRWADQR